MYSEKSGFVDLVFHIFEIVYELYIPHLKWKFHYPQLSNNDQRIESRNMYRRQQTDNFVFQ